MPYASSSDATLLSLQLIGLVLQVLALLGLAVYLTLLYKQLREMNKQTGILSKATNASVYSNIPIMMIGIDRFFVDYPELKLYFYNNVAVPKGHPDYGQAYTAAEMLVDFMDGVIVNERYMEDYPWEAWESYFRDLYRSSPILREYWEERSYWYADTRLHDILEEERSKQS